MSKPIVDDIYNLLESRIDEYDVRAIAAIHKIFATTAQIIYADIDRETIHKMLDDYISVVDNLKEND